MFIHTHTTPTHMPSHTLTPAHSHSGSQIFSHVTPISHTHSSTSAHILQLSQNPLESTPPPQPHTHLCSPHTYATYTDTPRFPRHAPTFTCTHGASCMHTLARLHSPTPHTFLSHSTCVDLHIYPTHSLTHTWIAHAFTLTCTRTNVLIYTHTPMFTHVAHTCSHNSHSFFF